VTIAEKPFIFIRPDTQCTADEILCPRKKFNGNNIAHILRFISIVFFSLISDSTSEEYESFCCRGYCIDLLKELSKNLSFVYTLHLVTDNKYGSIEKVSELNCSIIELEDK